MDLTYKFMRLTIKGTDYKLTDDVQTYIERRLGGLEKFLPKIDPDSVLCRVEIGRTTKHHQKGPVFRAEANLDILGQVWRSEGESDDVYAAIDEVHEELMREIVSRKGKMIDKNRRRQRRRLEL